MASMVDKLSKTLAKLQRAVTQREAAKMYQLPLWPEPERGFPNEIIRSALFPAVRVRGKLFLDSVPIASTKGYAITYTGAPLTQADGDVYEGVMHLARGATEGNRVVFSRHSLLKLIGRKTSGTDHNRLIKSLKCLSASAVTIERTGEDGKRRLYWGSLIPSGAFDEATGLFSVEVNRDLVKLFERGFTRIEWDERYKLAGKPLARWLHGYYASHTKPFALSVAFLAELSGSETATLYKFRQNLKAALAELVRVGFLDTWSITARDLVEVVRTASPEALPPR
jgi:hypothetical protein